MKGCAIRFFRSVTGSSDPDKKRETKEPKTNHPFSQVCHTTVEV